MLPKVADIARGKWYGILLQLGMPDHFLTGRHGPCPLCEGRDRFRFTNFKGDGGYICNQCSRGTGIDLVMKYFDWSFNEAAIEIEKIAGGIQVVEPKQKADPNIRLRATSTGTKPVSKGDAVSIYLENRGLSNIPNDLRYGTQVKYFEKGQLVGEYPAMVATVRDSDGKPNTLHITYLKVDAFGHVFKSDLSDPRKVLPPLKPLPGCAVRLFDPDDLTLGIAEGIETAMAAQELYGLPVWATLNASQMEVVFIPEHVTKVVVFADNDASFTGQKAAYTLANRLMVVDRKESVIVRVPPNVGEDFLDVLRKKNGVQD